MVNAYGKSFIGKTITGLLKEDIIHAVGTLQTCVGLESGIEAAIHAVRKSFEEDNSECLLLVDADNAFNKLNRKVSLENIKRLCPPMYTYLHNSYNTPAMLYLENGDHILSQECDARRQCSYGNVCPIHTTTDASIEQRNCKR